MDDWEQFFAEKSRRRFEKERIERRRRIVRATIAIALAGAIVVGATLGLGGLNHDLYFLDQ